MDNGKPKLGVFAVLEFRNQRVDHGSGRDEKSGQVRNWHAVRTTLEGDERSYVHTEYLPEGSDGTSHKSPFKKGDIVVVTVMKQQPVKGGGLSLAGPMAKYAGS